MHDAQRENSNSLVTHRRPAQAKADIAASFQSVAVAHLMEKTRRGVAWAKEVEPSLQHMVVAGGVACNKVIRAALQELAGACGGGGALARGGGRLRRLCSL